MSSLLAIFLSCYLKLQLRDGVGRQKWMEDWEDSIPWQPVSYIQTQTVGTKMGSTILAFIDLHRKMLFFYSLRVSLMFYISQWGKRVCYWYLVGVGRRCFETSCSAQGTVWTLVENHQHTPPQCQSSRSVQKRLSTLYTMQGCYEQKRRSQKLNKALSRGYLTTVKVPC